MGTPDTWGSWDGVADTRKKVQEGPTDMLLSSKQCCPVLDLWIKISFVSCCRWLRISTLLPILGLETILFPCLCHRAEHYIRRPEPNECHNQMNVLGVYPKLWARLTCGRIRGRGGGGRWGAGRGGGSWRTDRLFPCNSSTRNYEESKREIMIIICGFYKLCGIYHNNKN